MATIEDVRATEILDSRGNPTVKVKIILEDGTLGEACVPSGASTGKREALELRDGDPKRFFGKGVRKAVENVNRIIGPEILGMDARDQIAIDKKMIELDGTSNKSNLGANAILGVSLAVLHAAANFSLMPLYRYIGGVLANLLPVPMMNIINGGAHAPNNLDFQEYMIAPCGATSFHEAMRWGSEIYHTLKNILKERGLGSSVGDEGGFAPDLNSNEEPIKLIIEAIEKASYKPGEDVFIAIDVAASNFERDGKYILASEGKELSTSEFIDYLSEIVDKYPIICIEDGLSENDKEGWPKLTEKLGKKVQITADDFTVTNPKIIEEGIKAKAFNSVLIKLNQIGTVTETLQAIEMVKNAGFTAFVSHRSGETEDTTIADLCVGKRTGMIKSGAPCRSERLAKYNRLLEIEEELKDSSVFLGLSSFYSIGR